MYLWRSCHKRFHPSNSFHKWLILLCPWSILFFWVTIEKKCMMARPLNFALYNRNPKWNEHCDTLFIRVSASNVLETLNLPMQNSIAWDKTNWIRSGWNLINWFLSSVRTMFLTHFCLSHVTFKRIVENDFSIDKRLELVKCKMVFDHENVRNERRSGTEDEPLKCYGTVSA